LQISDEPLVEVPLEEVLNHSLVSSELVFYNIVDLQDEKKKIGNINDSRSDSNSSSDDDGSMTSESEQD
jgi:hypothetical protein